LNLEQMLFKLYEIYLYLLNYFSGADCLDFELTAKLNDIQLSDGEG